MPDFNQIVKEVKSVLRPGIVVPKDKESDPLGYRIAELDSLIKKLAESNAQQGKDIAKINNMLVGLFEDLQKMKGEEAPAPSAPSVEPPKAEAPAEPSAPKAEEPPQAETPAEPSVPKTEEPPQTEAPKEEDKPEENK